MPPQALSNIPRSQADKLLYDGHISKELHKEIAGAHDAQGLDLAPGMQGASDDATAKQKQLLTDANKDLAKATGADLVGRTSAETGANITAREQGANVSEAQANKTAFDAYLKEDAERRQKQSQDAQALAAQKQADDAKNEERYQANLAEQNQRLAQHDAAVKSLYAQKVDPEKYWHDMSAGEHVMKGIGLALSAAGSALTGTENASLKLITQGIDNNVKAQMNDIESKRGQLNDQGQSLRDRGQAVLVDAAHRSALTAESYATAKATLDAKAAELQDPAAKLRASQLSAQLAHGVITASEGAARYKQQLQSTSEAAAAARAMHQQVRGEKAIDTETDVKNKLREVGGQAAATIDVNDAKGTGKPKGPAANLGTSVADVNGYRDADGNLPDTGAFGRHLPNVVVSDRDKAFRSSVDATALTYLKQIGVRPKGDTADEQSANARKTLFGSDTPNAAQLNAGLTRAGNLSKNPNAAPEAAPPESE